MQRAARTDGALAAVLGGSPLADLLGDATSILCVSAVCRATRALLPHLQERIKEARVRRMRDVRRWRIMLRSVTSLAFSEAPDVSVLREAANNVVHLRFHATNLSAAAVAVVERMPQLRTLYIDGVIRNDFFPCRLQLQMYTAMFERLMLDVVARCGITHLCVTMDQDLILDADPNRPVCNSLVDLVLHLDERNTLDYHESKRSIQLLQLPRLDDH